MNEAVEGDETGGENTLQEDIVGGELHDGCLKCENGLLAECCSHGVSEGGSMCRELVRDGAQVVVVKVSESELLSGRKCSVFDEDGRRDSLLGFCEYKGAEAVRVDPLVKRERLELEALCCKENKVLE